MDDDYIFVQESTAAAKIWKIPVDGTSSVSSVNVEGVSGGTHAISCIRMVPNTASGVNGGDGRFYIIEGESTTDWADMLGSKRNVIYQAAIQENLAYTDGDYHAGLGANPSPKTSGNSAIDCAVRVKSDGVYFAVMKQHVGLSLFKMSMK